MLPAQGLNASTGRVGAVLYALPAVPLAFLGLPLYVYLPAHYAALPGIGLATVGVVLLLARLLDLVTDPAVGLASDRLRHRLRPQVLMVVGALLMAGGAAWLFDPPPEAGPLYLFAALGVTYLGWTLLAIPYYALGAELGARASGGHAQTGLAAWREAGMIVGTVLALLVPALAAPGGALATSATLLLWLALPAVVPLLWVGARSTAPTGCHPGLWAQWRDTSRAARELLGVHLLNSLAGGTAATLFVLYAQRVLGVDERTIGMLLLGYFAAGLVALPLWVRHARRVGLVTAWRRAMLLAALGFLPAVVLGEGDLAGFLLVCIVTGATLGADIALPAALQAHIVDAETRHLRRPRGGTLFGLWGMASKLALALAAGVSLPLLGMLSGAHTGWSEPIVLAWLYAGLPVTIKLLAVLALRLSSLSRTGAAFHPAHPEEMHNDDPDKTAATAAAADPVSRTGGV